MKSNKGFTLIELLAVIVILAIIALIATPMILGVVENARKSAAVSSVLGYVDAVEKQVMMNAMNKEMGEDVNEIIDDTYTVSSGSITGAKTGNTTAQTIDVKGTAPKSGTFELEDGEVQCKSTTRFVTGDERYDVTCSGGTWSAAAHSNAS